MNHLNVAMLSCQLKEILLCWKLTSQRVGTIVDKILNHFCTSEFSSCDKRHERRLCIFLRSVCIKALILFYNFFSLAFEHTKI